MAYLAWDLIIYDRFQKGKWHNKDGSISKIEDMNFDELKSLKKTIENATESDFYNKYDVFPDYKKSWLKLIDKEMDKRRIINPIGG